MFDDPFDRLLSGDISSAEYVACLQADASDRPRVAALIDRFEFLSMDLRRVTAERDRTREVARQLLGAHMAAEDLVPHLNALENACGFSQQGRGPSGPRMSAATSERSPLKPASQETEET